jgi:hypothetical protein
MCNQYVHDVQTCANCAGTGFCPVCKGVSFVLGEMNVYVCNATVAKLCVMLNDTLYVLGAVVMDGSCCREPGRVR